MSYITKFSPFQPSPSVIHTITYYRGPSMYIILDLLDIYIYNPLLSLFAKLKLNWLKHFHNIFSDKSENKQKYKWHIFFTKIP